MFKHNVFLSDFKFIKYQIPFVESEKLVMGMSDKEQPYVLHEVSFLWIYEKSGALSSIWSKTFVG